MQVQCYTYIKSELLNFQNGNTMIKALIVTFLFIAQTAGANSFGLIIDPGHSFNKPGAISCSGKPEYIYNVELSEVVLDKLLTNKIPAMLTHKTAEEISLNERSKVAKGNDLLLSVHHDSVQPQFITWNNQTPCSAKAKGYSIFISQKNKYYSKSLSYAQRLGIALIKRGYKPSTHHSEKIKGENRQLLDSTLGIYLYDDLVVLKKSDAPAILLEAAVIVNPQDDLNAKTISYKRGIAEAVVEMMKNDPESKRLR